MASGGFSAGQINAWMAGLLSRDLWLTVVTADPRNVADPFTAEVLGEAYEREQPTFALAGSRGIVVTGSVTFFGIPADTHVAGVMLVDAPAAGAAFVACAMLDDPVYLPAGGPLVIDANDVVFGIDMGSP